jgi:hypothetical protein
MFFLMYVRITQEKECMCHEHLHFFLFLLKNASNKLPAVKGAHSSVAGGGSCSAVEKKKELPTFETECRDKKQTRRA